MKISIILPVYNQADKALKSIKEGILPTFDALPLTYDVLIEADHSSKEEVAKLEEGIKDLPPHVKLVPYEDKVGKGHAVRRGIEYSSCDYDLFMDADLATDLSIMKDVLPLLGKADAIIASRNAKGSRYVRKQPLIRRITHFGCRKVVRMFFGMKEIKDTQCGFKLFKDEIAKKMIKKQIIVGSAFDVEYLYYLHLNGHSIVELPCIWKDDPESTAGNVWKQTKRFYGDLRKIKKNKDNYLEASHADR